MEIFDLYGFPGNDLRRTKTLLEQYFKFEFEERESDYFGTYISKKINKSENLSLKENYNNYEGEWLESKFEKYPLLLYVDNYMHADVLYNCANFRDLGFVHLRRSYV